MRANYFHNYELGILSVKLLQWTVYMNILKAKLDLISYFKAWCLLVVAVGILFLTLLSYRHCRLGLVYSFMEFTDDCLSSLNRAIHTYSLKVF